MNLSELMLVYCGAEEHARLRAAIRDVPDFPKPGIMFKDITGVLADPDLFHIVIDAMHSPKLPNYDVVLGLEARGFLFAAPLALAAGRPLVLARKPGKLPRKTHELVYGLEYGKDKLCVHDGDIPAGARVLIVDDVLATGGTATAACELVRASGAEPVGLMVLMELTALGGQQRVPCEVYALLTDADAPILPEVP